MCGIVGYVGYRKAYPIIISGLKRLEYRGYDSAGVALYDGKIKIYKKKGKVSELEKLTKDKDTEGTIGMGHTRWATHGAPSDENSHPHVSNSGNFSIIHNGIIENYSTLKKELLGRGYTFNSATDTEVLVNFIEDIYENNEIDATEAVRIALNNVIGAYGIVVMCKAEPEKLIVARRSSPIAIGVGEGEFIIASDATPIVEHTKDVVYLNDNEIAVITKEGYKVLNLKNESQTPYIHTIEMELEALEKGGYDHFMLKEIFEQPRSIADSIRGRIDPENKKVWLGGLVDVRKELAQAKRFIFVACGTSWHAGLVGEYLFEEHIRIPVEVEYASEFRYRNPVIQEGDIVIAISQSGETADTLAAINLAKERGALVLGICNVVGSSISRATHAGVYTHAGPEIGVASTKAFTAQVSVLTMMALFIADLKGKLTPKSRSIIPEMLQVPEKVRHIVNQSDKIKEIAATFKDSPNCLYLGRGSNFPVALEGALKLKEISYIHAEGYPAAEMKHGPIALIDENMPVIFIATKDESYEKIVSNIEEVAARKGRVVAIVTEGDTAVRNIAEFVIEIPEIDPSLMPLLSVIPLQILSYHIAVMRNCNVDQPRNLAKSVTVE
ncbi:MAG: glutamine--fructose-6-phosphate transaminase (isomerizing) [Bacteroidia bacterium]|nr:glutamine--fructose-6-phosphate transaminase (isomerizing) [Bacteroidia bacterium]